MSNRTWWRKSLLVIAGIAAAWIVLDLLVLDCWKLRGTIVENPSGDAIVGARVLVSLLGDKPHAPVPHAQHKNGLCITSFEVISDERGNFRLQQWTLNQFLINKRAVVTVFAPGWYTSDFTIVPTNPGLAAASRAINVNLKRDDGLRWSSRNYSKNGSPLSMDPLAEEYQRTMSRAITETSRILSESYGCGVGGGKFLLDVLSYVASRAQTDSEKQFIVRECKALLKSRAYLDYQSSRLAAGKQVSGNTTPLRCDGSLFHQ